MFKTKVFLLLAFLFMLTNSSVSDKESDRKKVEEYFKSDLPSYSLISGNEYAELKHIFDTSLTSIGGRNKRFIFESLINQLKKKTQKLSASQRMGNSKRVMHEEQICPENSMYHFNCEKRQDKYQASHSFTPNGCEFMDEEKRYLGCDNYEITEVPKQMPSDLDMVDFNGTQIRTLDCSSFDEITVKVIRFFQNKLKYINSRAFESIKGLKSIMIIHNDLKHLGSDIFLGLNDLEILMLDDNEICFEIYNQCNKTDVEKIPVVMPKLRYFSLANNPLKVIHAQMWAGLRNSSLHTFILNSCSLENVHPESFSYIKSINTLRMDNNPRLDFATAFKGLKDSKLVYLSLNDNAFIEFPTAALSTVSNTLRELELKGNSFETLRSEEMPHFPNLRGLNLNDCFIRTIELTFFDNMPNLNILDLKRNKLHHVSGSIITSINKLTYLDISENPYGDMSSRFIIPDKSFANKSSLRYIIAREVPLRHIHEQTFAGLVNLDTLILRGSQLETIEDGSFHHMKRLKTLVLSQNKLAEDINSETFGGLESLEFLHLDNNLLNMNTDQHFDDRHLVFKYLSSLKFLNIAYNLNRFIFYDMFKNSSFLTHLDISHNKIQSWNEKAFDQINLTNLNFNHNRMDSLNEIMLQDFQTGMSMEINPIMLDLSNNPFLCCNGCTKILELVKNPRIFIKDWDVPGSYQCHLGVTRVTSGPIDIKYFNESVCLEGRNDPVIQYEDSSFNLLLWSILLTVLASVIFVIIKTRQRLLILVNKIPHVNLKARKKILLPTKSKSDLEEIAYDFDAFVSYHHEDEQFLENLLRKTEGENSRRMFRICIHERDFEVGVPITENIVNFVDRSRKVIILLSNKYLQSVWCRFEMKLAYHRLIECDRKSLLIIVLEEEALRFRNKLLNYILQSRTYLEWPGAESSAEAEQRFWKRLNNFLDSK